LQYGLLAFHDTGEYNAVILLRLRHPELT
jgi:hypothetical protein